ncbi:MAG: M3 family metallopeptidase [bacterium]|nr:M3 family metallopeptidase [bacterium]
MPSELYSWNLSLLYASKRDPAIEKDTRQAEILAEAFEKKYQSFNDYLKDSALLKKALIEYEELVRVLGGEKPIRYFSLLKDLDVTDDEAEAALNKLTERFTIAYNRIKFFEIELGKIPKDDHTKLLADKDLSHFHYYLKQAFLRGRHLLSLGEEQILSQKMLPSHTLWILGQEKNLNRREIVFKNQTLPLAETQNKIPLLGTKERKILHNKVMTTLKEASDFAESEINALLLDKKIDDRLRGFADPFESVLLDHQIEAKSVNSLLRVVNKNFHLCHRFYAVKAKLLGMRRLTYADRNASIPGETNGYSFEEATFVIRKAIGRLDPRFAMLFDKFLKEGHIDAFPKKKKKGGGYCFGGIEVPTFILMNYVPGFGSLMTLAHEMGHAIHTELSKSQTPLYQPYSLALAETASNLFELIVFEEINETLPAEERCLALHNQINGDVASIFRQIACFNYEQELHARVRREGSVSREHMAKLHNDHMKRYLGPLFELTPLDGYFFVQWSHIRRFFYVYTYAYGLLIARALFERYKKDRAYASSIIKFLSAGGSESPAQILREIGIDITNADIFREGLKSLEEDIAALEKLSKLV